MQIDLALAAAHAANAANPRPLPPVLAPTMNNGRQIPVPLQFGFENVTLYLQTDFSPRRIDTRSLTIRTGVQYAQYEHAVEIFWIQGRRRTPCSAVLTSNPFLIVVARDQAIHSPETMAPLPRSLGLQTTPGVESTMSRYSSFDPRWRTDFLAALGNRPTLVRIVGQLPEPNDLADRLRPAMPCEL